MSGMIAFSEPVVLTNAQIDDIVVYAIPSIPAADEASREILLQGVRSTLAELLMGQRIVPELIANLKNVLLQKHLDSLAIPGSSIGINGSSGMAALIMQLTLNTFHLSGSASTASGLDAMRDIIMARASRTGGDSCVVVFKNKLTTFEQALASRSSLVGCTVKDFIRDKVIDDKDTFQQFWWHNPEYQQIVFDKVIPDDSQFILRLHLDSVAMVKHEVTIENLATIITKAFSSATNTLGVCIHGPFADAIIDIYPLRANLVSQDIEDPDIIRCHEVAFLDNTVFSFLSALPVKGIKNINGIYPQIVNVTNCMKKVEKLGRVPASKTIQFINDDADAFYQITFDSKLENKVGISIENLRNLFTLAGCQFLSNRGRPIVALPPDAKDETTGKYPDLLGYVNSKVTEAENQYEQDISDTTAKTIAAIKEKEARLASIKDPKLRASEMISLDLIKKTVANIPRPKLVQAMEYIYIITSNLLVQENRVHDALKSLLSSNLVDCKYTYSNNMHTMAEVLGIEATLNMTIQELQRVIGSSGAYVHPSVIIMIAEFIMSRGTPYGATFTGISRHPGGHLPAATLERAGSVFTKASAMGAAESIDNISSSIVVAARIKIGTGMCDVGYRYVDENGQEKLAVNESIYKSFKRENKEMSEGEAAANLQELQSLLEKNGVGIQFDFNEENKNNVLVSTMVGGGKGLDKKNDVNLSSFIRKVMEPVPEVDKTPVVSPDFSEIMAMLANKGTVITAVQKEASPNVNSMAYVKPSEKSSEKSRSSIAKEQIIDEDTEFEVTIAKPKGKTTAAKTTTVTKATAKTTTVTKATAKTTTVTKATAKPNVRTAVKQEPIAEVIERSPTTAATRSPTTATRSPTTATRSPTTAATRSPTTAATRSPTTAATRSPSSSSAAVARSSARSSTAKPNVRTRTAVAEPIEEAPVVKPARRTLADLRKTAKNTTLETTDAL